jgi:hypothetical protein
MGWTKWSVLNRRATPFDAAAGSTERRCTPITWLLTRPSVSVDLLVLGGVVADTDADVGVPVEVASVVVVVLVVDTETCEAEELEDEDGLVAELEATTA